MTLPGNARAALRLAGFVAYHFGAVVAIRALAVLGAGYAALRLGGGPVGAAVAGAAAYHLAGILAWYVIGDPEPATMRELVSACIRSMPPDVSRAAMRGVLARVPARQLPELLGPLLEDPTTSKLALELAWEHLAFLYVPIIQYEREVGRLADVRDEQPPAA